MEKLTDPEIEKFTKLLRLISQKVDELGENLDTRLSRLEHIRNVKRSATPMSCEVKFNVLPPENPDGFSNTITATNSPRIQCLRGQKTIPGDEDPDKTITTKIITSGDVVSQLSESTLEDSPVIQKSEECRQQEMIQTGCVAEEDELIASDNGCGTSVLYKIKRTEGECPQGDIQSENSTPGILSEILHENSNDLGELQCDSVADFSDSVRLSGTTAAIQLDGTELDAPWKCDKARWSKHPEVGAGNPTERDRALDALWKSDDNVCDAEVARNVSAPSSAMQAEKMCQECVPFIFVPSPDKVQIKQPPPRKSSTDLETATGSDTSRRLKKFTALCVVGTKEPRFEGLGKREPLEQENGKSKEEKGGHEMDSVDQVDESTVKIGDLQPRRGRKRRKRNTNDHNRLYIAATECSQGEFKISDGSIVGSEIWPPSCGEPPPCARQRDQSMASALVESGKKARVEMWFCKQGLVLTLPLRFREADNPHVARDVREIKGPPISASGEISLFGTKRIEKGAVKRCSREIEEKMWGSQERSNCETNPLGRAIVTKVFSNLFYFLHMVQAKIIMLKFVCLLKMTTELPQIQIFNGDNFHLWKFQMKIILEAKDLLRITDGSEVKPEIEDIAKFSEWKKKDAKSKMLITTALEFKYLQQIVNCQTSAEMWKKLSTIYELKSETNKYLLQQRFFEYKMNPNDNIASHISKVETQAQQMKDLASNKQQQHQQSIKDKKKNTHCGYCKKKGHWWKECYKRKEEQKGQQPSSSARDDSCAFSAETSAFLAETKDSWIADSGATDHMTFRREWFSTFEEIPEGVHPVCLGEGKKIYAKEINFKNMQLTFFMSAPMIKLQTYLRKLYLQKGIED
ncbi:hypothetical protein LAZ67_3004234 [Cordylochernes scorpioides]|uniref:Retrovirus-related Pol polyprotein from transposon TNT 1-94-like beta-barrel domain-containing protein n=1 Tax=Cordylochernes scorpioides TaxID=51811 RepID=A0ABY6KC16_9ARAC|nr:hypothetical protein LAZ67_3004234 [Cordylochernes scorpioides]